MSTSDIIVTITLYWSVLMVCLGGCLMVAALGWELAIAGWIRGWQE